MTATSAPAIGQEWPEQGGVFIGTRLIDGVAHHIIIPGGAEFDLVDVLQKRHFGRMPDEVQRAFDAARAALSAQPDAQKKGGSDAD